MKKTTIFFDLDNTLIDRMEAAKKTYWHVLRYSSIPEEDWNMVYDKMWSMDHNGEGSKFVMFKEIADIYGFDETWISKMKDMWFEVLPEYTMVFEKSRYVLETLKKYYKLGMITNGSEKMQSRKIELSGLEELFDTILIAGAYQTAKPDPKLFSLACEKIGCKSQEAYFVGDSIQNDIIGSYQVGMEPIYIWRDNTKPCDVLDVKHIYKIEDLLEVISWQ